MCIKEVKRQITKWERVFANRGSDGVEESIKDSYHPTTTKENNSIKNRAVHSDRRFSKEDEQTAKKQVEGVQRRWSSGRRDPSRSHLTPARDGYSEREMSVGLQGVRLLVGHKMDCLLRETVGWFFRRLTTEIPREPASLLPGVHPKDAETHTGTWAFFTHYPGQSKGGNDTNVLRQKDRWTKGGESDA